MEKSNQKLYTKEMMFPSLIEEFKINKKQRK